MSCMGIHIYVINCQTASEMECYQRFQITYRQAPVDLRSWVCLIGSLLKYSVKQIRKKEEKKGENVIRRVHAAYSIFIICDVISALFLRERYSSRRMKYPIKTKPYLILLTASSSLVYTSCDMFLFLPFVSTHNWQFWRLCFAGDSSVVVAVIMEHSRQTRNNMIGRRV